LRKFKNAEKYDLKGQTIMPGFIEPHLHPLIAAVLLSGDIIAPHDWDVPEEVKKAIENNEVVIVPTVLDGWGATAPPFHYVVYDKSGKSIAIEPIGGKLVVFDNPIGVMTNSPSFDWHMTNLRNYTNLKTENVNSMTIEDVSKKLAPVKKQL